MVTQQMELPQRVSEIIEFVEELDEPLSSAAETALILTLIEQTNVRQELITAVNNFVRAKRKAEKETSK